MRRIKNICRLWAPMMALTFIASLLEWIVIVRSENSLTTPMLAGTYPKKIKIPIGGSANITCRTFEDENSSMIVFEEKTLSRTIRQPSEDIIIINNRTAVLAIRNATEHKFEYSCKIGNHKIGETDVFVGSPPKEVTDFTCRSYNFQYMACTFTRPKNVIYTNYELNFTDSANTFCKEMCKNLEEKNNQVTCYLTQRNLSHNFYVVMQKMYYFNLTGSNELGTRSQIIAIKHSNIVVPAKLNITLVSITTDSVILKWNTDSYEAYRRLTSGQFDYEISLQPKGFEGYYVNDYENCNEQPCKVLIKYLQYAYYEYSLSVRAKVKEAPNITSMWSEPFNTTFRTKDKKPDRPPSTAPGSFYMSSNLHLYWQDMMEYERNGPGFHYIIETKSENGSMTSVLMQNSVIELPWDEQKKQTEEGRIYYITAVNVNGYSPSKSEIRVYADKGNDFKPKIVSKAYKNHTYIVSWKPPKYSEFLVNYTIFWCSEKRATVNNCSGSIYFEIVDKNYRNFTIEPQSGSLNIAVSANYENYSTGMNWACLDYDSRGTKFEPRATAQSTTSIRVDWSVYRICGSVIKSYNLIYCQMEGDNETGPCLTESLDGEQTNFVIDRLKPYTKYGINITMFTKKPSESFKLFAQTMETAPTAPRNLTLIKLTSQSATISWLPPEKFNGELRFYEIYAESKVSNETLRLNERQIASLGSKNVVFNCTINNLKDFTEYEISVIAQTVQPSPRSEPIRIKTLIGKLNPPRIDTNTKEIFNWTEPVTPTGRLQFYEVAMLVQRDNNETYERIIRTKSNECRFRVPECRGSDFTYFLKVRAVYLANQSEVDTTILPHQALYNGTKNNGTGKSQFDNLYLECTKPDQSNAYTQSLISQINNEMKLLSSWEVAHQVLVYNCPVKFSTFSSIAIIILFLMVVVSAYGGCKKYKKMNNIDVVLPPGLVDHLSAYKTNNVGYGNKNDKEPSDFSRSSDCLVNNKENFHLLGPLGVNSGNVPNGVITIIENNHEDRKFNFERDYNNAFQREETSNGSYDEQNSSQSTDSIEINDMSSVSYTNGPLYNDMQIPNGGPNLNISTDPALNGYVSIPPANDTNIGYITADRINSFQSNFYQDEESKKNTSVNDTNPNGSTSMYVTPSQLAQLGRSERLH